jgi:hypothetical protein
VVKVRSEGLGTCSAVGEVPAVRMITAWECSRVRQAGNGNETAMHSLVPRIPG